ncbi:MAG: MetQ/NlpA family ABC transporter substrate-binding protein [Spirochaetales bacterium]|nr:MetQ/NlpA family ABC transporter substrate-binding protein [Spirochaetales bacterium]
MKKLIVIALVLFAAFAVSAQAATEAASNKIVVGATPEPHAVMLDLIKEDLAAQGYTLEVKVFNDYVTPNEAVESGDIDANFFQHIPYLESFNRDKGFHLVNAGGIHIEPLALYSKKYKALADIPEGAKIAIPNDPSNEGRALLLLASAGLITLNDPNNLEATPLDIKDNPKKLTFAEVEAATLPRVLDDVDAAVINGNYAIPAGFSANRDGLVVEGAQSPYVNVIAVKSGNEKSPAIQALVKALQSDKVKKWVAETYKNGEVVVVF